jgi:N,N'-diacetyllegionaminate synthase
MKKVIIIAEAGINHNASLKTAKKLIDAAVDAGVDYVKFQTIKASKLLTNSATTF